jgi:hypothetical protein
MTHSQHHCTIAHIKSPKHIWSLYRLTSCTILHYYFPFALNPAHGCRYIDAERTETCSQHISCDRYPASILARRSDLQKKQLPLLLRVGPCLQSCCLATNCSNPLYETMTPMQITVAVRFKAWTVFARSNTGILGSNLTQGMDVCLRLLCVFIVLYR